MLTSCSPAPKSGEGQASDSTTTEALEDGFVRIFDGESLAGWQGDTSLWRVENGNLVGEIKPGTNLKNNSFIIWQGETETYTVCPITSQGHRKHKIILECRDFLQSNVLDYKPSFVRPNLIHSYKRTPEWRKVGTLTDEKMAEIVDKIQEFLNQPRTESPKPAALQRPPRQRLR